MASRSGSTKSRGRGTAGAFGFLLLIAGLIGGGLLFYLASQRPTDAIESFARAGAGCTTTLDFQDGGTFFVYQEVDTGAFEPTDGCEPRATPGRNFDFALSGPSPVEPVADQSLTYESGEFAGASVARFEIAEPGLYEIAVFADDVAAVAAVGRDPDEGTDELRRGALIAGGAGVVLGLLLLVLAGRRSRRAGASQMPEGPGWAPRPQDEGWPPAPPTVPVPRMPINPQQPDEPVEVTPPPPPLPAREPGAGWTSPSWAPPGSDGPVSTDEPQPAEQPRAPMPTPTLPSRPAMPAPPSGAAPASRPAPPPPRAIDPSWQVTAPPPPPPPPPAD